MCVWMDGCVCVWPAPTRSGVRSHTLARADAYTVLLAAALAGDEAAFTSVDMAVAQWALWDRVIEQLEGPGAAAPYIYAPGDDSWLRIPWPPEVVVDMGGGGGVGEL